MNSCRSVVSFTITEGKTDMESDKWRVVRQAVPFLCSSSVEEKAMPDNQPVETRLWL